jgi:ubiquitin thioesterase protein OTUB1
VSLGVFIHHPIVDNGIAVAFSYFETLLRIGDAHKFLEEETRLKSLCNILNDAGFQEHLYEDFMEDTIDLLRKVSSAADGNAVLLETFNDPNGSMSIITYLKARACGSGLVRSPLTSNL